jgi:hypothetical protein
VAIGCLFSGGALTSHDQSVAVLQQTRAAVRARWSQPS